MWLAVATSVCLVNALLSWWDKDPNDSWGFWLILAGFLTAIDGAL